MSEESILHQLSCFKNTEFLTSLRNIGEEGKHKEMLSGSFGLQRKPTSTC